MHMIDQNKQQQLYYGFHSKFSISLKVNFHSAVMRWVSAGASILHASVLKQCGLMGNKANLSMMYLLLHLSLN